MEEEEEDVECGDLFARRIYLSLLQGYAGIDEFLFFQPLLQEELVGGCFGDLLKWVHVLPLHDR